jgi:hypothetical protein
VLTYYVMSRYVAFMTTRALVSGICFGIGAYFVMNYVVIPLSATARGAFSWPVFSNGIAIHALGSGLPAAWFVSRTRQRAFLSR